MAKIYVTGSLLPSANVPLDNRTVINTIDDITSIDYPFVGMLVYVKNDNSYYKVTAIDDETRRITSDGYKLLTTGISDVKVGQTSVVTDGVATIPLATAETAGAMSAADKAKLDGAISSGANVSLGDVTAKTLILGTSDDNKINVVSTLNRIINILGDLYGDEEDGTHDGTVNITEPQ